MSARQHAASWSRRSVVLSSVPSLLRLLLLFVLVAVSALHSFRLISLCCDMTRDMRCAQASKGMAL
jgi:hypothetical protein